MSNHNFYWNTVLDIGVLEKALCSTEEKRAFFPLIDQIIGFCALARRDGILVLEPIIKGDDVHPLLEKGLRLAVDGTDPDVICKTLYYYSICGGAKGKELLRNIIILEGVLAVQTGCNPRLLKETLLSLLGDDLIIEAGEYFKDEAESVRTERGLRADLAAIVDKPVEEPYTLLEDPIARIYPSSILTVLRELEDDELAFALCKASGKTITKVLSNMTVRYAAVIIEDMKRYSNSRPERITKAQENVLKVLERLKNAGTIGFTMPTE